ncbi:MAG: ABC-type transport auxiliary lipoprotein family protein [Hyphomonadaceae bacterium]
MIRVIALSASALALSGCISLLPEPPPPPRLYTMEAGEVARAEGAPVDAVLGVSQPGGERTLLGGDLVWRTGDTLAFVAESQWSTRAEEALQAMVVQTIQAQGRFRAAVRVGDARNDYALRWDVVDFEVVEADMTARFVVDAMLLAPGRRVIAAERISAEAPVSDRSSSVAAQALTRAAREASARMGLFAADAASQEEARAAAQRAEEGRN